jgi:hypothetical protein
MADSRPDVAGDRTLGRSLRLGKVRCVGCNRLVGLVWFGKGPDLVEPVPIFADDGTRSGLALLLHVCPNGPSAGPASGAARRRTAGGGRSGTSGTPRRP